MGWCRRIGLRLCSPLRQGRGGVPPALRGTARRHPSCERRARRGEGLFRLRSITSRDRGCNVGDMGPVPATVDSRKSMNSGRCRTRFSAGSRVSLEWNDLGWVSRHDRYCFIVDREFCWARLVQCRLRVTGEEDGSVRPFWRLRKATPHVFLQSRARDRIACE